MNISTEHIVIKIQCWRNMIYRKFPKKTNAWTALEAAGYRYKRGHYVYINGKRDGGEKYLHAGDTIAYLRKVRVAAALISDRRGNFLVAKRTKGKFSGMWEFPGGKIEQEETAEEAVVREIKEELDIRIIPHKILGIFSQVFPKKEIEIELVSCSLPEDEERIVSDGSHSEYKWIQIRDAEDLGFAPIDTDIIDFLQK